VSTIKADLLWQPYYLDWVIVVLKWLWYIEKNLKFGSKVKSIALKTLTVSVDDNSAYKQKLKLSDLKFYLVFAYIWLKFYFKPID
jgi:hypothetical protein